MKRLLRRHPRITGLVIITIVIIVGLLLHDRSAPITNFDQCSKAGYPIQESDPEICSAHGKSFVGPYMGATAGAAKTLGLDYEIMVEGDSRGTYPQREEVIRTQAAYVAYWNKVHAQLDVIPPLLPVDFTKNDVVALSAGVQQTNGYSLEVVGASVSNGIATINTHEIVPGITCHVQNIHTNPYFIARLPKLPAAVKFINSQAPRNCN